MPAYAARKQPQLSLEELLHLRWLIGGALALLSIWMLFYLEASIWPAALLATGVITLCLLRPRLPGYVPGWLWRLGVPIIAVIFAVDLMLSEMIDAFVRLNVLLVLHRATSYRTRREDLQLAALCLFLVIITGVLTVSLLFAAQILIFTALALVFLFIVNIVHAATGEDPVPPQTWNGLSRRRLAKHLLDVFDLRLLGLGAGLFFSVVLFAIVIFLAIPRFQMESALSFLQFNRSRSLTGFSEQIALGDVTSITQDHAIAMRVDVGGDTAVPSTPYWRMVVLDSYERGMFSISEAVAANVGPRGQPTINFTSPWNVGLGDSRNLPHHTSRPGGATVENRYTVFLESGVSRFLPLPGEFRSLRFTEMQDIVENRYFETLSTQKHSATMLSFQIEGADFSGVIHDPHFRAMRPLRAPADLHPSRQGDELARNRFLNYPATTLAVPVSAAGHAYLRELVDEITGGAELPAAEFARRACAWLERHHLYSLNIQLPPSAEFDDPVLRWLRARSDGHCEFFAAAFVLLSRTAGHPARAVTGFKGGTWNAYENYFMVRNSHAHAWCEVFDGNGSWLRVDPTPGSVTSVSTPTEPVALGIAMPDSSARAYLDSLRMLWYRRIVNFDEGSQRQFAGSLREMGGRATAWSRAIWNTAWDEFNAWIRRPWTLRTSGDLFFYAFTLLLITGLMRYFGVGTSDLFAWLRRDQDATRQRAGDLLRRLRICLAEPRARSRRFDHELARDLEAQLCRIRFGRPDSWPAPLVVFRATRRLL